MDKRSCADTPLSHKAALGRWDPGDRLESRQHVVNVRTPGGVAVEAIGDEADEGLGQAAQLIEWLRRPDELGRRPVPRAVTLR